MREIRVVCAVVREADRVFVARRSSTMPFPGTWEFPGGKVEDGETDPEALARELREELRWPVEVGAFLAESVLPWGEKALRLVAYKARSRGEPELQEHDAHAWVMVNELDQMVWAPADPPLLPAVKRWLEESDDLHGED